MARILVRHLCCLGLATLLSAGLAAAQDDIPKNQPESRSASARQGLLTLEKARIGFNGRYKAGFWAPVWLTLRAGEQPVQGRLTLQASDGDSVPVIFTQDEQRAALDLPAGEETTALLYVRVGPQRGRLSVQLRDSETNGIRWEQPLTALVPRPAHSTQELIVTIGAELGVEEAIKQIRRPEETAVTAARVDSTTELPDQWRGYEGVDWVFLSTRSPEPLNAFTDEQFAALREWVLQGGRLVLSTGSRGEEVLADDSRWRVFAPGELVEVRPLRDRSGLELAAGVELPWDTEEFQQQRPSVTQLENFAGQAEIDEGGQAAGHPLAIRAPHGFGHVIWFSFELDTPAIAGWLGRTRIVHNLLQQWHVAIEEGRQSRRSVQHLGYEDLSGQLRSALEQFPRVTVVSFTNVAVLTIAYLLLIGPADYLLFRRLGLPSYGTWITFPVVALLFCGIAWYLGKAAHGERMRLNQVEIVDLDATEGVVRASSWHHLYAPRTQQLDLGLEVAGNGSTSGSPTGSWLVWQGLPGSGLGGLASRQVSLARPDPYVVDSTENQSAISGLPIQIASSKSLSGRWWGRMGQPVDFTLTTDEFGLLRGEIANPTGRDLRDCWIAYRDWMYRVGDVPADGRVSLADVSPMNLEARLTQRRIQETKDITTPWDQSSLDVPRIVQIMMFHDLTRGQNYTGLTHRYQGYLDMTRLVRDGRAVLVGRSEQPAAQLLNDDDQPIVAADETRAWTWYRLVLPVEPTSAAK